LKNRHNISDLCVYFDEQSFFLYPIEKLETGKKVEIDYKYIAQIENKINFINISKLAKKAILFHTLHLSYQINTSEKNAGKSTHYLNLYDKEIATLRVTYFKNKHSKDIKQKFRKV
jgi:cyanate lyase